MYNQCFCSSSGVLFVGDLGWSEHVETMKLNSWSVVDITIRTVSTTVIVIPHIKLFVPPSYCGNDMNWSDFTEITEDFRIFRMYRPFCCLDFFDTYPTCNGVAMPLQVGWIQDSRFKIPTDSFQQILNPNLESNPWIQDSRFLGTLSSKSWIQDSRFKIPRDPLQEILNPGFKMDSRFAPKSSWESWILNLESWGWIQDLLQRVPRNLESWILNPGVGFKICSKEFLGILNLESWILGLDSRFAPKSSWESWILNLES